MTLSEKHFVTEENVAAVNIILSPHDLTVVRAAIPTGAVEGEHYDLSAWPGATNLGQHTERR